MKKSIRSVSPKGQITLPVEIRRRLGIGTIPARRRLAESYRVVPALKRSRTLEEMTRIANDEHALHVAKKETKEL